MTNGLLKMSSDGVFHTVQGEGKNLGVPSVFVRLSLCNLHCGWCDTPYTWNFFGTPWEHDDNQKYDKAQEVLPRLVGEVALAIFHAAPHCRRVVITGGEPLMQQGALAELIVALDVLGFQHDGRTYSVEIETNGTIAPTPGLASLVDQFNVSPKLTNSGNAKKLRDKPAAMAAHVANPKALFKFVIAAEHDLYEVIELMVRYGIPAERIYLMPEGRVEADVQAKAQWLTEQAKEHGFNITTRLHILTWGSKRSV